MFNANHEIVKFWVELLQDPIQQYTIDDIPELYNLKEIIQEELNREDA